MESLDHFDLLIIGGGIGGVIALHYAKKAGLKTVLLERQDRVGGLWVQLPAWQDIQNNANDWTLGDLPIAGTDQASIASNIQAWVDTFDLSACDTTNFQSGTWFSYYKNLALEHPENQPLPIP